jgi:carboxylesterase type B
MDGTYLTTHELIVNNTARSLATDVSVLLGNNRDEVGVNIDDAPLPNQTFTAYLDTTAQKMFNAPANLSATLGLINHPFPGLPPTLFNTNNTATEAQILNATIRLASDALFTCYSFAKAYSAAKHAAFKETYYFEFNRTYQTAGYTRPWCVPPKSDASPHGDPHGGEYFKCHAGEQMVVFGTALRGGLPDRDGRDVMFMQLVVDYWAAFARNGDPNPEAGWLRARGYEGTLREVEKTGRWERVRVEGGRPTMRVLQWGGRQAGLGEGHNEVCGGLGVALDALEVRPVGGVDVV